MLLQGPLTAQFTTSCDRIYCIELLAAAFVITLQSRLHIRMRVQCADGPACNRTIAVCHMPMAALSVIKTVGKGSNIANTRLLDIKCKMWMLDACNATVQVRNLIC